MPDSISGEKYAQFLVNQTPVFEADIIRDIRPTMADLVGYYATRPWEGYDSVTHIYDRFRSVHPDTTRPWEDVQETSCAGNPCDPTENKIGYGSERRSVTLMRQSWGTPLWCFDGVMTITKAREHTRQIISEILRPATVKIQSDLMLRKAAELAKYKYLADANLTPINIAWDNVNANGYRFLLVTNASTGAPVDPPSRLTYPMLQSQIRPQLSLGAIEASDSGFNALELHTDMETFQYLGRTNSDLKEHARFNFSEFANASKEYQKYAFKGTVGDYMTKCLMFPMRFNRVSAGRYERVLPYRNVPTTTGIGSEPNPAYEKAQYTFSYINHRQGLHVRPFRASALNPEMPFLVRDYAGSWRFAIDNLSVENKRRNKGQFYADFLLAVQPYHDEFLTVFFHKTAPTAIQEINVCAPDPGAPEQNYNCQNAPCPGLQTFVLPTNNANQFELVANGGLCNNNVILEAAITNASLSGFVAALQAAWTAAGQPGTWTVVDASTNTIQIAGTPAAPLTCGPITLLMANN